MPQISILNAARALANLQRTAAFTAARLTHGLGEQLRAIHKYTKTESAPTDRAPHRRDLAHLLLLRRKERRFEHHSLQVLSELRNESRSECRASACEETIDRDWTELARRSVHALQGGEFSAGLATFFAEGVSSLGRDSR